MLDFDNLLPHTDIYYDTTSNLSRVYKRHFYRVIKHFVIYRPKLLSPSPSQSEELICILLWPAAYCSMIKLPPGPTRPLSAPCHPPTVCRTSNDFHLSCPLLYVFKPVSKGPCSVTLAHIPPVSLWLWPIHHPVYNYSEQLPLPPVSVTFTGCVQEKGEPPHMSILRLSAEVIRAGYMQANLISDRIKTSETVWGASAPGWGQLGEFSICFLFLHNYAGSHFILQYTNKM